jgi:C-terminal processing protease CtpA/Prc
MTRKSYLLFFTVILISALGCSFVTNLAESLSPDSDPTPTKLPLKPVEAGLQNPDEPVAITGKIPYTSPFFINSISQPFILLEDQAGFVDRNREFNFPLEGQVMGPVIINPDETLTFHLSLPSVPQGTYVDVDNNGSEDTGVQVFAVAYWSNVWNGPFLEEREGLGWSTAYSSTIVDPDLNDEITAGTLIVWAPDENQAFPVGFGEDGLLFSSDDPTEPIPSGYTLVDLNKEPFVFYKEAQPELTLHEGAVQVTDLTDLEYEDAFNQLFEKVAVEYPFTQDKDIDWDELRDIYAPRAAQINTREQFYDLLRQFTFEIPDAHINVSIDPDYFYEQAGGSFGMVLVELSDGRIIVKEVIPDTPADKTGIVAGTEIIEWDDQPVSDAISEVDPYFGPFSTDHHRRLEQVNFLTRVPPGTEVSLKYSLPETSEIEQAMLMADIEYESLFKTIPDFNRDELALPVEAQILDESGIGYMQLTTFSDDYHLMAETWDRYLQGMIDEGIEKLIIDIRANGGGSTSMSSNFAGYFFDQEIPVYNRSYYSRESGKFEYTDEPSKIKPAPVQFEGEIALLVSPNCISACEGFAYMLKQDDRATIVGHYPTSGAFGDVGRGQFKLPDDLNMQFPTGRPESTDGELLIEGMGIIPDVIVPVTYESALGLVDAVLDAAIEELN